MFENVTVVGGPLVLSSDAEVDAAEAQLGLRFPTGYREYVTRFGDGVLGGAFVRIYPPGRILAGENNVAEWRQRVGEFWFWEAGPDGLTREQAARAVILGDTFNGDELVVHPDHPEWVFVLPRDLEVVHVAGDGLPAALQWVCGSGTLTEAFAERNFEPAGRP